MTDDLLEKMIESFCGTKYQTYEYNNTIYDGTMIGDDVIIGKDNVIFPWTYSWQS